MSGSSTFSVSSSVSFSAASGFVSGAVAASPLGVQGQKIASGIIGGLSYVADCYVNKSKMNIVEAGAAVVGGYISGKIGGDGANKNLTLTNTYNYAKQKVARESRRIWKKYAQKAATSAISYCKNTFALAAWSGGSKYAAGFSISTIIARLAKSAVK